MTNSPVNECPIWAGEGEGSVNYLDLDIVGG